MHELKELINIALGWRSEHANTIKYITGSKKSLSNTLISDIYNGKINTDAEAQRALYGNNKNIVACKKLKERLRERLLTNILFTHASTRSQKTYAYNVFFCHKYYVIAMLFIKISHSATGVKLMQRVLNRAQKFQVTPVVVLAASILRKKCVERGDKKAFDEYSALMKHYHALIQAEDEADQLHDRLMIQFAHSYAPKPELIPLAAEAVAYIGKQKNAFGTYNLHLLYFLVSNLHAQLTGNYALALAVCNAFEEYFLARPEFYSKGRHANITIVKTDSLLCMGAYRQGLQQAEKNLVLFESMEGNRPIVLELQFVMALRVSDFTLAANCYKELMALAGSKNIYAHKIEMWQLLGGYLWLCLVAKDNNKLKSETFGESSNIFLQEILQRITIYKKDKQGVNISLAFLQFALLVQQKDYISAINKTEQLKTYMYKYISRRFGAREYIFLKLMLLLHKHNFDVIKAEKKAVLLLKKLETTPIVAFAFNNTRVEILEYKQLWQLVVDQLRMND